MLFRCREYNPYNIFWRLMLMKVEADKTKNQVLDFDDKSMLVQMIRDVGFFRILVFFALFITSYNLFIYASVENLPIFSIVISDIFSLGFLSVTGLFYFLVLGYFLFVSIPLRHKELYWEFSLSFRQTKKDIAFKYFFIIFVPYIVSILIFYLSFLYKDIMTVGCVFVFFLIYFPVYFYIRDKAVDIDKLLYCFFWIGVLLVNALLFTILVFVTYEKMGKSFGESLPAVVVLLALLFVYNLFLLSVDFKKFSKMKPITMYKLVFIFSVFYIVFSLDSAPRQFIYLFTKASLRTLDLGGRKEIVLYLDPTCKTGKIEEILDKKKNDMVTLPVKNILSIGDSYYVKFDNSKPYKIKKEFVLYEDFLTKKEVKEYQRLKFLEKESEKRLFYKKVFSRVVVFIKSFLD